MKGPPTSFWAKLEKDAEGHVSAWHPLEDHSADVAAVFEALLGIATIRRRLARLAGRDELDPVTRARLAVLVALHDLGKANLGFQAKGRPELGTTAGHVGEALALLDRLPDEYGVALQGELLGSWGEATLPLLCASICHHGRPLGNSFPAFQQTWWRPRAGLDPCAAIASLADAALRWFPRAAEPGPELPTAPAFEHGFAGLVMLADWIGSDKDAALFPYSEEGAPERIHLARERAARALELTGIAPEAARRAVAGREPFEAIAPGKTPRAAQRALLGAALPERGSVTVLEAETGSGKTEAALGRFLQLFSAGQVDGLMFALPTRTAATQIFERVVRATADAFPDKSVRPPVVLAVPGYLRVDEQIGRRHLPGFEVLWPDNNDERMRHRGWAAEGPKRFLAGAIVVGTVDQVLLSALAVGHSHLRAASLLRHLLVVDEVHASDAYMTSILKSVLSRHVGAGGHALLLSATLGGEARAEFLGTGRPPLGEALRAPYPLVSANVGDEHSLLPVDHDGRERQVFLETRPLAADPCAVATLALASAASGAKVIVLRNTVAECVATQRELETLASDSSLLFSCRGVPSPHHSRYARDDRQSLDVALEARFGKDRAEGGCVVVATQTIQQSLDLDADLLLTDLCPIDVLLQRIGRLHRHERRRPEGFADARAIVLVPADRDLGIHIRGKGEARGPGGLGTVYDDLRVLEATWQLIEKGARWTIPTDCRRLVEEGVHSEILARVTAAGGDSWKKHAQHIVGDRLGDGRLAGLNLVDWARPYGDPPFPDDRRVPTRLGESDRRALFAPAPMSPFGNRVRELTISAHWTREVPADVAEAEDVVERPAGFAFRYGPAQFVYDRLGLRPATLED